MSAATLLAIDDLHAGYESGVDILQGLSLSVAEGSLTVVIGPNGAGKSTLLKTIFGFLQAHRGTIHFRDQPIERLAPHAIKSRGISYVPQEINTFPLLTVEENLRMGGWLLRHDRARLRAQLGKIYDIFPVLAERRGKPAGDLSGGQGRMLSVAREMMTDPTLMLVDEPTAGLAPALVSQVYALLQTARRSIGSSILLVDQNVEDAIAEADTVYMVNLGRIKAAGPASEFPPPRVQQLIQECLLG
jgi:ABC-type branched-subunit amino acid transport system ATPase component